MFFNFCTYQIYDIYLNEVIAFIGYRPMTASIDELTRAREAVDSILEELHVDAYVFEVEPNSEIWEIIIECAIAEGWQRIKLPASREHLLHCMDDTVIYQSLIATWRDRLADCKLKEN